MTKPKATKYDKTIAAAVEWLKTQPQGADCAEIAALLRQSSSHVTAAMYEAQARGVAVGIPAPSGTAHNRRMFFTPEHAKGQPERIVQRTRDPMQLAKLQRQRATSPWQRVKGADGIWRTVAPLPADPRYSVQPGDVVAVFGSLQVGSYLPAETWAARAYGAK